MRPFIIVSSLVVFGSVFGGCKGDDDDKGSSKQAASADEYCATVCSALGKCDGDVDQDTCRNECRRNQGVTFESLRSDFVKAIEACVESKDCVDIIDGNVVTECREQERAKLTTTPAVESFCEAARAKVEECDGVNFNVASCYEAVKENNDRAVDGARTCFDKSCTAYNDCLVAAIDVSIN